MKAMKTSVHEHYVLPAERGEHADEWSERACADLCGEEERFWCSFNVYWVLLKDGRIVSSR